MTSFLNEECRVLLRNHYYWVLVGRPLVLAFLILALSKMVAEKNDVTLNL
jgi:hypothetical protein